MKFKNYMINIACILICVHAVLIVIAPFQQSLIYRSLPKPFILYLNQSGLNNSWNMFAPDPIPQQKLILSYYANKDDAKPEITIEEPRNGTLYGLRNIRNYYIYHYFFKSEERIYNQLTTVLCKDKSVGQWRTTTVVHKEHKDYVVDERVLDCE